MTNVTGRSPAERRVGFGFALQPFLSAALGFVLFPVLASTHPGRIQDLLQSAIVFGVLTGTVGAAITGGAAYPAFQYLTKRRVPTASQTVLLGAAFGNIPAAIAIVGGVLRARDLAALPGLVSGSLRAIVFGALIGATCGAVFWLIAGRHVTSAPELNSNP